METSNFTAWEMWNSLTKEQKSKIWTFIKGFNIADSITESNIEIIQEAWKQREEIRTAMKEAKIKAEEDWQIFMKLDVSKRLEIQKYVEQHVKIRRISRENISHVRAAWANRNA